MLYNKLMASTITNLDNIDVWKTKSNFNYDAWQENITIKLVNVPWDKHTNVVRWQGYKDRRDFFNKQYGIILKDNEYLGTINNLIGTERVRVNIPYKDIKYNYLAVYWDKDTPPLPPAKTPELGGATTDSSELFQQAEGMGDVALVDDRFYFIEDARQVSPSVSELTLSLDVWGTFSDRLGIDYAHYERGNYMSQDISVDEFLSPTTQPRFKMAINTEPEPITITSTRNDAREWHLNGGNYEFMIITDSPWYDKAGEKWVLDADHWTRDGYYSENREDWMTATNPTHLYNYVVSYADMGDFMHQIYNLGLPIMKSIKLCAVLDANMVDLTNYAKTYNGIVVKYVTACQKVNPVTIDTTKLITNKWSKYYKAYEGQFMPIDIFNNGNFIGTFGLENFTNTLTFTTVLSTLYPYVEASGWINGINGDGHTTVTARNIGPQDLHYDERVDIPTGDWQRTLIDLNIPLVMLRQEPTQQWNMERKPAYDITTADATNSRDNSLDANNVNLTNTTRSINNAKTNGDNSVNTGATNANASNDTGQTNELASINTGTTNAKRSNSNSKTNADTSNTAQHNANTATINEVHRSTLAMNRHEHAITTPKDPQDPDYDDAVSTWDIDRYHSTKDINRFKKDSDDAHEWATTQLTATGAIQIASRAIGALAGGFAAAGAVGAATSALGATMASGSATMGDIATGIESVQTAKTNLAFQVGETGVDAIQSGTDLASALMAVEHRYNTEITRLNRQHTVWLNQGTALNQLESKFTVSEEGYKNTLNTNNEKIRQDNATTIAQNNYDTTSSNITDSDTTSRANANRSHTTTASNIKRSQDTSLAINEADRATSQANADDSKNLSDRITTNNYNRTLADIDIDRKNSYLENLVEYGVAGGDYHTPQTVGYGYQFVIRYPSQEDMAKIDDMFDEYGYTWNKDIHDIYAVQMVDDNRKFNYWKLSDIRFSFMPTMERYRDSIRADLERGVRVWDAYKMTNTVAEEA